jgi:CHAT domain-containing protein
VTLADPAPGRAALEALGRDGLPSLPGARAEAAAAARAFPGARLAAGAEASEALLRDLAPSADILHLGVHALVNERLPLSSALVLAPDAEPGSGLLHAWEVMESLRTRAELVVLSACDSGRGEVRAGEGLLGLTWAFQRAGARAVLASLWRVDDEAAAIFIAAFYRHLASGAEAAEALRRAQNEFASGPVEVEREGDRRLLDFSPPRHWAGWVLVGG